MDVFGTGLVFPEGPVALPGGDVLVCEIQSGDLVRMSTSGDKTVVAHCGGGPNGAAIGPDGCVYVCNNGGFDWTEEDGRPAPTGRAEKYLGGSIQRVDPESGLVETLYDHCGPNRLNAPNDIVFDNTGGFYFTDIGTWYERKSDDGVIYYARPDGRGIQEAAFPVLDPNGIGLSPDWSRLYVADSRTARVWSWPVQSPGVLTKRTGMRFPGGAELLYQSPEFVYYDSLAVDGDGNVCVAVIMKGGIIQISPDGECLGFFAVPDDDPLITNICFGVDDRRAAYITASGLGRLYQMQWPAAGAALAFERLKGG